MKQIKLFEEGGVLPSGYSLDTITFGTALATINTEALNENVKEALALFKNEPKLTLTKLSYSKAALAYFKIIKNFDCKATLDEFDVLVTIQVLQDKEYSNSFDAIDEKEAVNLLTQYLKIKSKMEESIINKEVLEKIRPLIPNIVYNEMMGYSVGAAEPEKVEPKAEEPISEQIDNAKLIELTQKRIEAHKILLEFAEENEVKGLETKIKIFEKTLAKLQSKKEEGGTIELTHTFSDPKEILAQGGGFKRLASKVAKSYEGEKVPAEYQKEYGKTYSKEEAEDVGRKVAAKVYRQQLANQ